MLFHPSSFKAYHSSRLWFRLNAQGSGPKKSFFVRATEGRSTFYATSGHTIMDSEGLHILFSDGELGSTVSLVILWTE